MRLAILATLVLASAVSPAAFAQRSLNPIGNNGNILRPGIPLTGSSPQAPRGNPSGRTGGRRSFGGGTLVVPYPVYTDPFYSGYTVHNPAPGEYDPSFGGYTPYPNASGYPAQQQSPTVVINQNFQPNTVRPQFRDYSNVQLPEPGVTVAPPPAADASKGSAALADDQPTIFLIAMQDQSVLATIAYWVQGDTLNYITPKGDPGHVSLALVDRSFSKQLNAERNVPFKLPAPK